MAYALPDLNTRTVLNIVEENFQKIGRKTYATRIIYIGEHTLHREELKDYFENNINRVNSSYCDIKLNGLLLVYDSYFLHILEGSEDTIHRHLRFLFEREEQLVREMKKLDEETAEEDVGLTLIMVEEVEKKLERTIFKRLKLIMIYDCIKTLQFHQWRALMAKPPSLIGKLDLYGSLQEHMEQLRICLDKIIKCCEFANADINLSFVGLSAVDPKMEALPEVALLDFLLQSPHMIDLHEFASFHRHVDDHEFYFEKVWPLPTQYTPRLLYKLKIDDSFVEPLPVMPWETVKKEADEDEYTSNLDLIPDVESVGSSNEA